MLLKFAAGLSLALSFQVAGKVCALKFLLFPNPGTTTTTSTMPGKKGKRKKEREKEKRKKIDRTAASTVPYRTDGLLLLLLLSILHDG